MKKLLKSEVCGSREQCTGPTSVHCSHRKVNHYGSKKKKRGNANANAKRAAFQLSKPHLSVCLAKIKSQLILLFSLFLLLFMGPIALFGTIHEFHYTILVNFYLYLQYFQQKVLVSAK